MKPRYLLTAVFAGFALGGALWLRAADAAPAAKKNQPGPMIDMMAEQLGLSPDQKAKADEIMQKQRAAMRALHDDNNLSPEDRRDKARELMASTRDQMKGLLTPEQQKKADELRHQVRERWTGPGPRGPMDSHRRMGFAPGGQHRGPSWHGMMPGREQNPMHTLMMAEQIKDRMAERLGLTDEQRTKLDKMGRDFRVAQRDAMKKHRDEMRAVLTPEQQKKADEMKNHFQRGGRGWSRGPQGGPGGPNARPFGDEDFGDEMDDADFEGDDFGN